MLKGLSLSLLLLLTSCSTELEAYKGYNTDFRDKAYSEQFHVGATCDVNCIYSSYAVEYNIQEKQYDCAEGPCSCVKENDAWQLCNKESKPDSLWQENNTQEVQEEDINVPYYNQYDNDYYPSSTCQNTSIAMVLSYFQYDIQPDSIYLRWGKDMAQSPSGLNAVYKNYSASSSINTYTNASPEDLINALQQGYIAIVHGYFTSYGHVLVVSGYDDSYYYVNDPAGVWKECFKCGYTGEWNGSTRYSKQAFEKAVFTSDGSSYLPGWIHLIKGY